METRHPTPQRKRRWKLPLILVVGLLVAVLVAPTLITKTSLIDRAVSWAVPELDGRLGYGEVSASWFSPIEVSQLEVLDLQGQAMLRAERIRTKRSLFGIATNRDDLGLIQVSSPQIVVRVSGDTTNVEQLLNSLSSDSGSSSAPPSVELQIDDGTILIQDLDTNQSWQLSDLMVNCKAPSDIRKPLQGAIFSQLTDGQTSGEIKGQFQFIRPNPKDLPSIANSPLPPSIGGGQFQLNTTAFPMNLANIALRRMATPGAFVGHCNANLNGQWGEMSGKVAANTVGQLQLTNVQIALPQYLGDDQLYMQNASAVIDGRIENDLLTAKAINLTTDHGRVRFAGSAPLSELTGEDIVGTLLSPKSRNQYTLDGRIDLAGLLAALPNSFQVRDGTTITSGDLEFNVASTLKDGQRDLTGNLDARDLAASRDGQDFRWSQPVQIDFNGIANESGLTIERATCNSDFLQAQATGQIDQGNLVAKADLNRLMTELGQFFDLAGNQLSGNLDAKVQWLRSDPSNLQCGADVTLNDFAYISPDQKAWNEPRLTIVGQTAATMNEFSVQGIRAGEVTVTSGHDTLNAKLLQPVADLANSSWPLTLTLNGNIQNWLTRAQPWFKPETWALAGNVAAEVTGSFSPELVNIESSKATIQNLDFAHPSLHIQESVAKFEGVATWDGQTGAVTAPWFTLVGATLSLRGEKFLVQTAGDAITANGNAAFRGDVGKLYRWIQDPTQPATVRTKGLAEGRIQAHTQDNQIAFNVTSNVRDFAYEQAPDAPTNPQFAAPPAKPWSTVWQEPSLTLSSNGVYDSTSDHLTFNSIRVSGDSVQVEAAGQLTALTIAPHADLAGKLTYDLQRIVGQLNLGPMVQLFGKQTHPFDIQGPLATAAVQVSQPIASASPVPALASASQATSLATSQLPAPTVPPALNARATVGWEGASIYGMPLGPGQLTAHLAQGVVVSSPLDVQVGPTQLHISPAVHLNANPMTMVLEPGPLAQQVEITPEMCGSWLKYVTPLLSNATVAQGSFSVDLGGAQVPVTDPMNAAVNGKLTIHEARVQPGPLASQLVAVTDQVTQLIGKKKQNLDFLSSDKTWMELRDNAVEFQMAQGKVYHRNLNVGIGNVQVTTEGWVGVDQSMFMNASIPVLDEWIEGEALLQGLRGQKLTVPIRGTFAQPQLDKRAIANLSKELVGGAAKNYLQGELQKGLQKLIQGKK